MGEKQHEDRRGKRGTQPGEKDADRPETMPAEQLDPTTPPHSSPDPEDEEHEKPEFENPHLDKPSKR